MGAGLQGDAVYCSKFVAPPSSILPGASDALETWAFASVIGSHKLVTAVTGLGCSVAGLLLKLQRHAQYPTHTGGI